MTLENLLRIGKLHAHLADKVEIARLLASAEQTLEDARLPSLRSGSRMDLAYRVIMQCGLAAMLANGYRPATNEPGHHQLIIQSLPKTIGLDADRVRVLETYRATRNQSDYRGTPVSDSVANECVEHAAELLAAVREWLAKHRPELR
jgi:hypothetical protein